MQCDGCLTEVTSYTKCTLDTCRRNYCGECTKIVTLTPEAIKSWVCPHCIPKYVRTSDSTPTKDAYAPGNVAVREKKKTTVSVATTVVTSTTTTSVTTQGTLNTATTQVNSFKTSPTVSVTPAPNLGTILPPLTDSGKIMAQLYVLTQEIKSLKKTLEDTTQSLTICHNRLDDFIESTKALDTRLKAVEKREVEYQELKITVSNLQSELNTQSQFNLRNEIEVTGIPEIKNENLHHTMLVLARKIGIDLEDKDIDWVSRVGPPSPPVGIPLPEDKKKLPRPVVMRILRRSKRDQFMKASKSRRNITSSDLDITGPSSSVYINERLTKENRLLFREARARRKQHGFAYCWCANGVIYVRQREGKAAKLVRSISDLDRIFQSAAENGSTSG
ncbi:hypothetical protein NE865_13593 [Phthorimaea operculella]|nr:hypothetical protein NE865_13593 [Phthorimaea operculella]